MYYGCGKVVVFIGPEGVSLMPHIWTPAYIVAYDLEWSSAPESMEG